jgi:hypothetical protein
MHKTHIGYKPHIVYPGPEVDAFGKKIPGYIVTDHYANGLPAKEILRKIVSAGWTDAHASAFLNKAWKNVCVDPSIGIRGAATLRPDLSAEAEQQREEGIYESELEKVISEQLKSQLYKMAPKDAAVFGRMGAGELVKYIKSEMEQSPENNEYLGISEYIMEHVDHVYFHFPLRVFPHVAQLFYDCGLELTVRPKKDAGPGTEAEKDPRKEQGGVSGIVYLKVPAKDSPAVEHLEQIFGSDVFEDEKEGDVVERNNTLVALSIVLLPMPGRKTWTQDKPLGPSWDDGHRDKAETYAQYNKSHLLKSAI